MIIMVVTESSLSDTISGSSGASIPVAATCSIGEKVVVSVLNYTLSPDCRTHLLLV